MKKNVKLVYITLNDSNNNSSRKKDTLPLSNGSIPSSKEKKSNFVFNKKKLNKNSIPNSNSKCYINKINNSKEKQKYGNSNSKPKYNSNLNSHSKKNRSDSKHKNLSLIKRNKNSPLRLITPGKTTPNKNINILHNKNKNKLNLLNNNSINNQKKLENNYNCKSKKISFFKDKMNCYKNGNQILSNGKNNGEMPIYHKKIDKNKRLLYINKNKNNIINISSDNVKKSINYYKQKENIITNNSLIMKNINDNKFSSNKENKIRNIYYPRSPINKSIKYKKDSSPIKRVSFIKNKLNENKLNDNNNRNSKIPSSYRIFKSENKFPDNYSYHEIVYKNSQKSSVENKKNNIKEEEKNNKIKQTLPNIPLRNNRLLLEELTTENNNYNNISTTLLINNQSLTGLDNKIIIPYYCTLNKNQNISLRSSIKEENNNINENICYCSTNNNNIKNSTLNPNLFCSPKVQKLDISAQYNEIETENEDIQTIHFFGEQMLKRNKNYNFNKINDIYTFPFDGGKNTELKRNNSSDNINKGQNSDNKTGINSIPFSYSYNQFKWKKYHKRNENKNQDLLINKNNKRFNHNIINRKKKKKLMMEKSLNEQFISKPNKNKCNDNTKDRISHCESSINLDNDSINDIIKEFEKEIEDDEKKDILSKNSSKRKEININENNENFVFSFFSENDNNSNMSKGSTNDSKVKKRKVRYYKTKNFDMEKNYDFFISPTKLRNKKNKIL